MQPSYLDDTAASVRSAALTTPIYCLTVVKGRDVGLVFTIDGSAACPLLIGTAETCSVRLHDSNVSRRHVSVEVHEIYLRVRDLSSTNGSFVNGTRVIEALLRGGEKVAVGNSVLRVDVESHRQPLPISDETSFGGVLGCSTAMRRLYPICRRLAESEVPLIIEGETGTGKEEMAEAIHAASPRAAKPFVVFDCTAVPPTLIESALFGHEKGAFTGASTAHAGVFEETHGGTLLIDEIGDLDKTLQSKLLRAIQKSEVRRVGGSRWMKFDVRIIAATRRDLDREVQAGRFRDDLFFRLAVARVAVPPLRERRDDIDLLARHFWKLYGGADEGFPDHLIERFQTHSWPGNVRELANTVARLVALGDYADTYSGLFLQSSPPPPGDDTVTVDFLRAVVTQNLTLGEAREKVQREFERRYVLHLLEQHDGDAQRAAAASGIGERYLRMIRARVRRA